MGLQDGRSHGLLVAIAFPSCEIAPKVQDASLGQVQRHMLPQIPPKDVHEGYAAPGSC